MQWSAIRHQYPNQFILIGNVVEQQLNDNKCRIIAGDLIDVSDDAKTIQNLYQQHKRQGDNVLYALPTTTDEFIVEDIAVYR